LKRLIGKPIPLITGKTLELALPIARSPHQHDARRMRWVELKRGGINAPLNKQALKLNTDRVPSDTPNKGDLCTKMCQSTGHIRGRSTQPVIHRLITRRITPKGTKAIDQGFSQTDHRIGVGHQLLSPGPSS
jgi:hypothetical protein